MIGIYKKREKKNKIHTLTYTLTLHEIFKIFKLIKEKIYRNKNGIT